MSHPIFEQTTSPLTRSNDGRLLIIKASHDSLPSTAWEVIDTKGPAGDRTRLRTYNRPLADAYVAGYDERERLEREAPEPVDEINEALDRAYDRSHPEHVYDGLGDQAHHGPGGYTYADPEVQARWEES